MGRQKSRTIDNSQRYRHRHRVVIEVTFTDQITEREANQRLKEWLFYGASGIMPAYNIHRYAVRSFSHLLAQHRRLKRSYDPVEGKRIGRWNRLKAK